MKKVLVILLILSVLSGCRNEKVKEEIKGEETPIPEVKQLQKLPDHPKEEDGIFIITNGETYNEDLWNAFREKTEKQENGELIIARYTIEGDVIYELLKYDGEKFTLYYDNSRDSFAGTLSVDPATRKHLYELDYVTLEEMNDTQKPFRNHFAFLSDTLYESEEEVNGAFSKLREGENIDLVDVFSDVRLLESQKYE